MSAPGIARVRAAGTFLAVAALAACGFRAPAFFGSRTDIEVREVGRSLYCGTEGEGAQARLLPDLDAVLAWQAERGVTLAASESLVKAPYAIVEMGMRPTGGYGLAVSRAAVLRGDVLILQATFVSPSPGSIRTQALSTPCALVQLPPGRYTTIEVHDPTGAVRATGGLRPPEPESAPPPPPAPATPDEPGTA